MLNILYFYKWKGKLCRISAILNVFSLISGFMMYGPYRTVWNLNSIKSLQIFKLFLILPWFLSFQGRGCDSYTVMITSTCTNCTERDQCTLYCFLNWLWCTVSTYVQCTVIVPRLLIQLQSNHFLVWLKSQFHIFLKSQLLLQVKKWSWVFWIEARNLIIF